MRRIKIHISLSLESTLADRSRLSYLGRHPMPTIPNSSCRYYVRKIKIHISLSLESTEADCSRLSYLGRHPTPTIPNSSCMYNVSPSHTNQCLHAHNPIMTTWSSKARTECKGLSPLPAFLKKAIGAVPITDSNTTSNLK